MLKLAHDEAFQAAFARHGPDRADAAPADTSRRGHRFRPRRRRLQAAVGEPAAAAYRAGAGRPSAAERPGVLGRHTLGRRVPPARLSGARRGCMRILYSHRIQSRDGQSVHVEELIAALRRPGTRCWWSARPLRAGAFGGESRLVPGSAPGCRQRSASWRNWPTTSPPGRRLRAPPAVPAGADLRTLQSVLSGRQAGWRAARRAPLFLEVNSPLADERSRFGGLGLRGLARRAGAHAWRSATRCWR